MLGLNGPSTKDSPFLLPPDWEVYVLIAVAVAATVMYWKLG